jgi:alginate O-acetyltransferase complex protein AlgI
VYCDFSGYTDIAIGVALLMGFRLRENFNSPYKAKNTGEFWQRWHISLSSWLKDYLYIPMGGNRNGSVFTWISLTAILAFIILIAGELVLIPLMAGSFFVIWLLTRIFPPLKNTSPPTSISCSPCCWEGSGMAPAGCLSSGGIERFGCDFL